MRDKGIWKILAILMVLVMVGSCVAVSSAGGVSESEVKSSSATIYVPDDYSTIQAAVNGASTGDMIIVRSGTYKENVLLDKKLTLIGDALPTIDALGKSDAISITADYCVVTGFRCVNATKSRSAGIIVDSDWNRIENNTCENNNYGICLKDSSNNTISNNDVSNNEYGIYLRHPPSPGLAEVRVNAPEHVEEGATFDVTIDVESVTDFNSAQFDLSFDPSIISVTDIKEGKINGEDIPTFMWRLNPAKDTVRMFIMMPIGESVSGSGYLAEIEFKVKGEVGEKSELTFSNGELANVSGRIKPSCWISAEVKVRIGVEEEEEEEKEAGTRIGSHNNFINYNTVSNNKYGFYLVSSSNNTLMNNIVNLNNRNGFYLKDSSNNTIKNNEAYENKDHGIYLKRSTNNEIMNNTIHENRDNGIRVYDSTNSMITSNEIYDNKDGGIYLQNSGNSTLTNNTISGNDHNFAVYGKHLSDYIQNIDASNKVDGKPVYYLVNKQDQQIHSDAGYVGVVNSTNITVRDLTLTNNGQGVLLAFSKDSRIENVNASNNKYGIYLDYSSNNVLMNNNASNNHGDGIYLGYSTNNEIKNNKILENRDNGIHVYASSNNNTIQNNEVRKNNDDGICLKRSTNNKIKNNEIHDNNDNGIYAHDSSNNNTVQDNEVRKNNDNGICLKHSVNNEIKNNEIHENRDNGIRVYDSTNSMIASNRIYDNKDNGIYLQNSGNSTLTNNTMSGNEHNFAVYGKHLSDYIQNIDASNKADGNPVYYLVNKKNQQIPTDAGYVGVVNSTNITVRDLTLTNNGQGVLLAFSNDSRIENINASNNKYGIYLDSSRNNVLMNNKVSNNDDDGIYLRLSVNNEIKENKIHENKDNGICVYDSSNSNMIQDNEVRGNIDDGVYLKRSTNNEITNNKILENRDNGIYVYDSSNNNTIQDNEVRGNIDDGIYLKRSTNNEIRNNKILENRGNGIYVHDSSNSMIASNQIYDNKDNGIYLQNSGNSTLTNNTISGNEHNFAVYGKHLSDYVQNIDTSNKVEGKPVYYLVNKKNQQIPTDAGYVGVVNSTNITVKDLALTNNGQGVLIAFSKDSRIENVNASNNKYGIYLDSSSNNVLMNNKVANNDGDGIYLRLSVNNEIKDNKIRENRDSGIRVYEFSNNNEIKGNKIHENRDNGICVYDSSNNTIKDNEIRENRDDGIYLKRSTNTEIKDNKIHENKDDGIRLSESSNDNMIVNNEISDNRRDGIDLDDSTNSMIIGNEIYNNKIDGIYLRNSGNSTLADNTISGNDLNFAVYGKHLSDYIQNIDASNKVDGKPVYYLINKQDQQIPTDAGYVGIINSTNITVKDLALTNNGQGVLIVFSKDSRIDSVNASDNKYGIYLDHSSNNVLMNNKVVNNDDDGIYLRLSVNNEIKENKIHENRGNGIYVHDSSNNNTIQDNEVRGNNDDGIYLKRSTNNEIRNNKIHENRDNGIRVYDSSNNTIKSNEICENDDGIYLRDSNNNFIYLSNFINNTDNIYSSNSANIWNSTEKITYTYNGTTYESYMGNYWGDYTGTDTNNNGIGDTSYRINSDKDYYPLMQSWQNYFPEENEAKENKNQKLAFSSYYRPINISVNLSVPPYQLPLNLSNVTNIENITAKLKLSERGKELLKNNGFVIIDYGRRDDIVAPYENLKVRDIPIFVTTDTLLHLYHIQFNEILKGIEEREFFDELVDMSKAMLKQSIHDHENFTDPEMKEAARRNAAYFAVALKLLQTPTEGYNSNEDIKEVNFTIPDYVKDDVDKEIENIEQHDGFHPSVIFNSDPNCICDYPCCYCEDYSQYVPRGHYTRSEKLKRYFNAMMWYGRMAFLLKGGDEALISEQDAKISTIQAALISSELPDVNVGNKTAQETWDRIYSVTAFFVGTADDLTPYEYRDAISNVFGAEFNASELSTEDNLLELKVELARLRSPKIYGGSGVCVVYPPITKEKLYKCLNKTKGMRFMGQRFVPDSYMFQQLVSPAVGMYVGNNTPFTMCITDAGRARCFPRGLDIMAVLGSEMAEAILIEEGDTEYAGINTSYDKQLKELKLQFAGFDVTEWNRNLYWSWLYTLKPLLKPFGDSYPTFMQTKAWQEKELQTSLASWTELRHDTILYAKQSYTPGLGVGIPPEPKPVRGYVEPVPEFYARLLALTEMTEKGLIDLDVLNETEKARLQSLERILERLIKISKAELENKELTEDDYEFIRNFGENLDYVVAGVDVEGKETTIVADVHTDCNTGKVLEEGVGYVNLILVAYSVPDGRIIIGAGPVFSYYEFKQPMDDRLKDKEWKEMLRSNPPERPEWVRGIEADW